LYSVLPVQEAAASSAAVSIANRKGDAKTRVEVVMGSTLGLARVAEKFRDPSELYSA
jgi:hypothetical protein